MKGSCRGLLILHDNFLEFASEKVKDPRQWDFRQIHKINRKGSDRLSFSTSEKDRKKLAIVSRNYRFRFENAGSVSKVIEVLLDRASAN